MSEKFPPRLSHPEQGRDAAEYESAPFIYNQPEPGYVQQPSFGFHANMEPIPGDVRLGSNPGERSLNAKVPIPRFAYPSASTASGRTSRACENCREQKAKCTGTQPSCQRCLDNGIKCSYGDRKRERMLKELKDLTAQVQVYEGLVRDLYPRLDSSSAQHVDQMLAGQLVRSPGALGSRSNTGRLGNPMATMDHTEEDFNRDEASQATGFVGEHSEMAWLYRLKRDLDQDTSTPVGESPDRISISSLNYFQDDTNIAGPDGIDLMVRPPQQMADRLVDDYFQTVHPEFPIIGKELFLSQYRSFYSNSNVRPGKRWTAVLNLIFAIAARHSHLSQNQQIQGNTADHLAYFTRAWRLSIGNVALLDHPNLQQVQVEGLAAFYLLSTGQVNRSWRIIGIAIRSAVAMGLNLRSESGSVAHMSKETRYRVWWALFMLDAVLCVMTGRPPSTGDDFCTTPLPVPYREEDFRDEGVAQIITDHKSRFALLTSLLSTVDLSSPGASEAPSTISTSRTAPERQPLIQTPSPNISLYFLYMVDLAFLMREVIETLYAPGSKRRSWLEMELAISNFNTCADNWVSRLPAEFQIGDLDPNRPFARQRASLGFRFYTTKLVLTQPCLRRIAYQTPNTPPSGIVCDSMATICVDAARQMLDILPEEPDVDWLYGVLPWWCVLHYVMQSITVLLVELFTRAPPRTPEIVVLVEKVQKAIRWLRAMSARDASSKRAWLVCTDLLSRHALKLSLKVDIEI